MLLFDYYEVLSLALKKHGSKNGIKEAASKRKSAASKRAATAAANVAKKAAEEQAAAAAAVAARAAAAARWQTLSTSFASYTSVSGGVHSSWPVPRRSYFREAHPPQPFAPADALSARIHAAAAAFEVDDAGTIEDVDELMERLRAQHDRRGARWAAVQRLMAARGVDVSLLGSAVANIGRAPTAGMVVASAQAAACRFVFEDATDDDDNGGGGGSDSGGGGDGGGDSGGDGGGGGAESLRLADLGATLDAARAAAAEAAARCDAVDAVPSPAVCLSLSASACAAVARAAFALDVPGAALRTAVFALAPRAAASSAAAAVLPSAPDIGLASMPPLQFLFERLAPSLIKGAPPCSLRHALGSVGAVLRASRLHVPSFRHVVPSPHALLPWAEWSPAAHPLLATASFAASARAILLCLRVGPDEARLPAPLALDIIRRVYTATARDSAAAPARLPLPGGSGGGGGGGRAGPSGCHGGAGECAALPAKACTLRMCGNCCKREAEGQRCARHNARRDKRGDTRGGAGTGKDGAQRSSQRRR